MINSYIGIKVNNKINIKAIIFIKIDTFLVSKKSRLIVLIHCSIIKDKKLKQKKKL
jgi:hypothetical protein